MIYVYGFFLILLNLVWLATVPFAMPGNWLMIISTGVFAWLTWDSGPISLATLIAVTILAFLGEVVEFLGGMGGAKKNGASFIGSIGAIMGAIIGAVLGTFFLPIPILGTILGSCIGAGIGTWLLELATGKTHNDSMRSGMGAGVGQLIGITTKFFIGILIWIVIAVAVFVP